MKPITLSITYDKTFYHSGETLNGLLCVSFHKALDIEEIKVKIVGQCKVEWVEVKEIHTGSERYVDQRVVLFNPAQYQTMEPGEYSYHFTTVLPSSLPETFESRAGNVTYYCKASVKTNPSMALFHKDKYKEKVPFTVHANVPVNLLDSLSEIPTVSITDELPWGCCICICIRTGKLTTSLNLNKKVYVPGENIIINAEINNQTSEALDFLEATLKQKITYIGTSSEKYEINDGICKTSCSDTLTPHAIFLWRNAVMKLPKSLPATDLGGCNIIKVEYTLEVTVGEGSSFCAPKERYEVPIKIGSTPLSNTACYIQKLEASPMMIQQ